MNKKRGFFLIDALITVGIAMLMVNLAFSLQELRAKDRELSESSFERYSQESRAILQSSRQWLHRDVD